MREPIEGGGQARREIQLTEAEIKAQLIQRSSGSEFVGCEIEDRLQSFVVASDGDTVTGRETIEQGVDSLQMAALQKVHGWAGFDKQQHLGGLVDTEEIRNRPLDAVVEKLEA